MRPLGRGIALRTNRVSLGRGSKSETGVAPEAALSDKKCFRFRRRRSFGGGVHNLGEIRIFVPGWKGRRRRLLRRVGPYSIFKCDCISQMVMLRSGLVVRRGFLHL